MNIEIDTEATALEGVLRYTSAEHSFGFDVGSPSDLASRAGPNGTTSFAIGTLQIEAGIASRRALFVWGLHPRTQWCTDRIGVPEAQEGEVFFDPNIEILPGVTVTVAPVGQWITTYDPDSGWVRVAADTEADDAEVKIAEGVIIGRRDGGLHSLWLQPVFE